mmetsp:Transcript_82739/g.145924  ORF Transcript_82739/g.145924 Transcript_82739/m.145924 type:complete len:239 (-) Transcript_82739:2514-3230(-)
MVQLPCHRVPGAQWPGQVPDVVRRRELVPTGAPRGDHHLPWDADNRRLHPARSAVAGAVQPPIQDEPQRRVCIHAGVLWGHQHHLHLPPCAGGLRVWLGGRHSGGHHGHHPGPPYALCRWGLRQRVRGRRRYGLHILPLGPGPAHRPVGSPLRHTQWTQLRVHGCRLGRLRVCAQHGWAARGCAGHPGAALHAPAPRILLVLRDWHRGGTADPSGGLEPLAVHGTARPNGRLLRLAAD